MVQGFKQYNQIVQNSKGNRCSPRRTRPPLTSFPSYLEENFTENRYGFTDHNGNNQGSMGNRMKVSLLPGAFDLPGSAPGTNELEPITSFLRTNYPEYNFIKGHMWNQEIGGQGVTKNLVPLTSKANSSHKNNVEGTLKNALRDFANFYERNTSDHPDYDKVYGFRYIVEIENVPWPSVSEHIVPNSIHVQVFLVKCDISGNISEDNSITTNINSRLLKGIWIDQNGVVTDD